MPVTQWLEEEGSRAANLVRKGRKGDSTVEVVYLAFGTNSDVEVHAYANEFFTTNFGYQIGDYLFGVENYTLEHIGDEAWRVRATYVMGGANDETAPEPLSASRSFDTTGGTQHFTQAISETRFAPAWQTAPNMQGAIGFDGQNVQGVDIVIPALQWTETYDVPHAYVTAAYVKLLAGLTGTTNAAAFRTFRPGEVLFVGCSGSQDFPGNRDPGPWTLSYKFVASQNAEQITGPGGSDTRLTIGSITGITKKGHEYLWVRYDDAVDQNRLIKQPSAVYVNKVYQDGNFALLGIGS